MAQKLKAAMPDNLDLGATWTLRFAAVDPGSGAAIADVNISNAAIVCSLVSGSVAGLPSPGVAPLWIPVSLEGE